MPAETIRIFIDLVALPDRIDELRQGLSDIVAHASQDQGCINYELQQNLGDSAQFILVGEWRDDGSFDRHVGSPPIQKLLGQGLLAATPNLRRYQPVSSNDNTADGDAQRRRAALLEQIERLEVPQGQLALWSLGQAGFVIKGGSTISYIDPYLSNSIVKRGGSQRRFPSPLDPADVHHAQIIFATHEHDDHTDSETLALLMAASPQATLVTSVQSRAIALEAGIAPDRIIVPRLGESAQLAGLTYTAIPAAHYEYEVDAENHARWMGFLINCNGSTLYHSGDTLIVPELLAALSDVSIDVALLPFNGRDFFREQQRIIGNLWPREVANLAAYLKPRVLIGIHNDLFEGNRVNPGMLFDEIDRRTPWQRCHLLQPGELYIYAG